ncbi:RND transporter [Dyella dinghuensis]|uniref:RND transporter n=1 Tax=Dyella dinghuensis TaxID=1920169 RepID=A0A432LQN1_9GAMM|nr:MMPL family transporter [Dyella dinghuensis]RUL62333.1 RND transporter [Dyella dinghuensis]
MTEFIVRVVDFCRRYAVFVVIFFFALAGVSVWIAADRLSVDTNTDNLFASTLPWRQHAMAFDREFPQFNNVLVAVVRGATPEESDETAAQLAKAMEADKKHFIDVYRPDADPFFRHEGLLLLGPDDLSKLLNSLMNAQPLLGPLASDPSARGLLNGVSLMAAGVRIQHADLSPYKPALDQLQTVLNDAADGHPTPLSWQNLLGSDVTQQAGNVRMVLSHPVLEDGSLQPGRAATKALERIRDSLPDVKSGRVRIDYTGSVALADVQFGALTKGIVLSTVVSLLLLALWLYLAMHSFRRIIPILITLLIGFALTIGFAALAVGTLNVISVAFAVLFIGLAVDFGIQFAVRLRDERMRHPEITQALASGARVSGVQIAVAAAATACGFLAFSPTSFVGVAELGTIAGVGMGIALVCTLTLLPSLLILMKPKRQSKEMALPFGPSLDSWLHDHNKPVLMVFAVLGLIGLVCAVRLPFDANPLNTQDPNSEPMRTLRSLADNPVTNPFNINIMVPDLKTARELSDKLDKLPEVSTVISAATFVPPDQQASLDQLDQAQVLMLPSLNVDPSAPPLTAAALRAEIADTHDAIVQADAEMPPDSPLRGIDAALQKLSKVSDDRLMAMNAAVSRFLPNQLDSLRDALDAKPVTLQTLPESIKRDWVSPNGDVRIQVSPTVKEEDTAGLRRFVEAVQRIAPDAGGPAVTTIASADTIMRAFQQAAVLATIAIAIVLLIAIRRLRDVGLVLLTLGMSALLTALLARSMGMAVNYANIISLPLLLGVGVSFNVYFVMNWRAGMRRFVSSASARAVLFSALTTGTAFGSLALSHDLGMASMGRMLLVSLVAVLLATFVFLPALLYAIKPPSKLSGTGH